MFPFPLFCVSSMETGIVKTVRLLRSPLNPQGGRISVLGNLKPLSGQPATHLPSCLTSPTSHFARVVRANSREDSITTTTISGEENGIDSITTSERRLRHPSQSSLHPVILPLSGEEGVVSSSSSSSSGGLSSLIERDYLLSIGGGDQGLGDRMMYSYMSLPINHPPPPKDLLAQVESSWEEIRDRVSVDSLTEKKRVFFHQGINGSGDYLGVSGGGNLLVNGGSPSPNSRSPEVWDEEAERVDEDEIFHALSQLPPEERAKVFLVQDKAWVSKVLQLQTALHQVSDTQTPYHHHDHSTADIIAFYLCSSSSPDHHLHQQRARAGGVFVFVEEQLKNFVNTVGHAVWNGNHRKGSRSGQLSLSSSSSSMGELDFIIFPWEDIPQCHQPEGSAPPLGGAEWLCDHMLITDGQDRLDTMCLSSTALEDIPRFRSMLDSILETQLGFLPIRRVPEVSE